MNTRIIFSALFLAIIAALTFFSVKSFKTHRKIGKVVGYLDLALIPPLIGNLLIVGSQIKGFALIGYYIYFLGMDGVMVTLVNFTNEYCQGISDDNRTHKPTVIYAALTADFVQMLLNTVFHHSFTVEMVEVQGVPYYRLVPHFGQVIHRVIVYIALFAVLLIFTLASIKSSKIARERFTVILYTMLTVGICQTYFIFTRTPIDRSMLGYGFFGLIITYFSIYYRPLRLLDRMLSNIAEDMSDALFLFDPAGKCIWANNRGFSLLGLDVGDLDAVPNVLITKIGNKDYTQNSWTENRVVGNGEEARYYTIENHSVTDGNKHITGSFLFVHDNTEEQHRVRRELYNSTHDILTGLYTKQYFFECIRRMLNENPGTEYFAVFVDVKNFKIVNDIFSTKFGDKALQQIADWIRGYMNEMCGYGRLAGDTFGAFMPKSLFESNNSKVEQELGNFIVTDGKAEHHLQIQLGVYEVIDREVDVSVMFDRAHLALSSIKDDYNTHVAFYDNKLRERVLWNQRITADLQDAIKQRQIRPYLQPIADQSGRIVGAEALARWIHPEHGFMPPGVFIPVFERNGMIVEVDRHMWRCACELLAEWKQSHSDLFISVNISPKDFYFTDVAAELKALVAEHGIEPAKLRVEITETVMINDSEEKMRILDDLRSAGFIVEMDDFGSGYSSLNLLKDMPVDVLKLDMKFLSGGDGDTRAHTIIRNIIRLSDELGIESLTEGVETDQQFMQLAEMGCKMFQGYYFAKPMTAEDFEEFARSKEQG